MKIALWLAGMSAGGLLVRRVVRGRRKTIDVGAVSEEWIAQYRGGSDP